MAVSAWRDKRTEHIRTDWDEWILLELALELAAPGLDGVAVRVQKHFDWFCTHFEGCRGMLFGE